jgi:S-adenosylmethionine hydrolase
MSIITLITDFGNKDHFIAKIKGDIYSSFDKAKIVDISNNVSPFNIMEAAYILENAYKSFPDKSVHIIDVDSEKTVEKKHIVIYLDNHFFISADNGILSILCQNINPEKIFEITIHDELNEIDSSSKIFSQVACHLAKGGKPELIGKEINEIKSVKNLKPFINEDLSQIVSSVIYIDNFGNVVTNLKRNIFEEIRKGRSFEISVRNYKFKKIYNKYSDIVNYNVPLNQRNDEGKGMVVFNSSDLLQISIYRSNPKNVGTASSLMGLKIYDSVTISFK